MKRLALLLALVVLFGGALFAGGEKEPGAAATTTSGPIKNPDTLIMASFGDVISMDPAVAYDNVSWSMLAIFYDRLLDFDRTSTSTFVPKLATEIPTVANGGISADGKTYTFKLRPGVKFSNGDPLTPEDVAYTFKRDMVTDPDGGPDWIWYQLFLGGSGSRGDDGKIAVKYSDIDSAITTTSNTVVFHLASPYPAFLSVLAGKWGSIVDKKWVAAQGGWDGTEATWQGFNNPATGKETLFNIAMGTGPYTLTQWQKGVEVDASRNDGYWGTKPVLKNGVYKIVEEWSTRKLMLLQGDADIATVNATNFPEMDNEKGITIYKNLAALDLSGMHFNLAINPKDNPNIGSGKLDGQGIPADFFSDINVRLGFIYAWDESHLHQGRHERQCHGPGDAVPQGTAVQEREAGEQAPRHGQGRRLLQEGPGRQALGHGLQVRHRVQHREHRARDGRQDPGGERIVHQPQVPGGRPRRGMAGVQRAEQAEADGRILPGLGPRLSRPGRLCPAVHVLRRLLCQPAELQEPDRG